MMDALSKLMREQLVPKGSEQVVRLEVGALYYKQEFVNQCVDEVERLVSLKMAGLHTLTPLEKLAIDILAESASIGE